MLILNIIILILADIMLHHAFQNFKEKRTKMQRFWDISWILLSVTIIALALEGIFVDFGF